MEKTTSPQTAYVDPKKRYYASPDVPTGETTQLTLGERGFTVTVARTVKDGDGKVVRQDSFGSRYIPEDAIYLVGKGGKIPAGQTLAGLYPGYTGSATGIDLTHWLAAPKPHTGATGATGATGRDRGDGDDRHRRHPCDAAGHDRGPAPPPPGSALYVLT